MTDQYSIKCPQHRKETVINVCTHQQCSRYATICPLCPDNHIEHAQQLMNFSDWVQKVSKYVEDGSKHQDYLKEQLSDLDQLIKWCEDDDMHLRKVEQHCLAQKALIADDLMMAREIFAEKCVTIQNTLDQQLDEFIQVYRESFKQCKLAIEDSYLLQKNFSAFSNSNNLLFKLQQSNTKEANDVMQGLKRMIRRVKQIEQDRIGFVDQLRGASQKITFMTDNLPVYQFYEGLEGFCQRLADDLQHHLSSKLTIKYASERLNTLGNQYKENKLIKQPSQPTQPSLASHSSNPSVQGKNMIKQNSAPPEYVKQPQGNNQISSMISQTNRTLNLNQTSPLQAQDISFKPLKKYQLDFNVAAIEVVSDTLFALSCSGDPYMRMFDSVQKRIHTLQAHQNPIICLQKWIEGPSSPIGVLQNNNGTKQTKASFLYTLSTDALIIWTVDNLNAPATPVPQILHRYNLPFPGSITSICPLQDGSCILLGDKEGGVEVYNYTTQKTQQSCLRGKHSKAINCIILYKRYDKALIASADNNLSVWRLLYNNHNQNQTFENAYCEQVINVGLGSLTNISLLSSNQNFILVTSNSGQISLFNLVSQTTTLHSDQTKNTTAVIDYVVVEDQQSKKQGVSESFCMISLLQGSKSLRFWRVQHKDDGWVQTESKFDVAISPSDSLLGPKMQFVQMPQNSQNPLVLMANEANKELLVYEIIQK